MPGRYYILHLCVVVYVYINIYMSLYVCVHMCVNLDIHVCICMCVGAVVCMCVNLKLDQRGSLIFTAGPKRQQKFEG